MYGVLKNDLNFLQKKLDIQNEFLNNNYFINSFGECKSYKEISMSANLSKNYYAEVTNRINTITNISVDNGLIPVFITITLNGCFRDALNGNFSRFKKSDLRYLPDFYKNKTKISKEFFTIKDLIYILNYQFHLFNARIAKKYKGLEKSYIRVFEPHKKDGVPHIHCLLFIPKSSLNFVFNIYKDIFNAPQNLRCDKISSFQVKNGEINGFQWSINNPTGYVMKYITKTFINFNEKNKLDYLSAWYVKYKVRRILTSRTPVPIWVYRKINFIDSLRDFCSLNSIKIDSDKCIIEWDFNKDYIFFSIPETFQELIYENGHLLYYELGKLKAQYYKEKQPEKTFKKIDFYKIRENIYNTRRDKFISKLNNQLNKFLSKNSLISYEKQSILEMNDFNLINYYVNFNHSNENVQRLGILENEMIKRGFTNFTKSKELLNLNDIENLEIYFIKKGFKVLPF